MIGRSSPQDEAVPWIFEARLNFWPLYSQQVRIDNQSFEVMG